MRKFIRNICALSIAGTFVLSGCTSPLKSNFAYPDDYVRASAPAQFAAVEGSTGNVGDVALETGDTYAVIRVENYGDIKIKLFPDEAPYAVQNFIDLALNDYFDGKNIHRIISEFMIQGGSLNGDGTGGKAAEGVDFSCEVNGNMRHFYGALCYANAGGKNTCQFYIVNNKTPQEVDANFYAQYSLYYSTMVEMYLNNANGYEENTAEYFYYTSMAESYKGMIAGADLMAEKMSDEIAAKYAEVGGVPFLDGGYTVFGQTIEGFDVIDAISSVETTMGSDGAESKPVKDIIISDVAIMTAE